jgi:hypothetical protein
MRTVVFIALLAVSLLPVPAAAAPSAAEKQMAQRISRHLHESGQLRNYRIGVIYRDGVVSLAGNVANAEQRDTAIKLAKQIRGVKRVNSRLQFASEPAPEATSSRRIQPAAIDSAATPATGSSEPNMIAQAYGETPAVARPPQRSAMQPVAAQISRRQPQRMPRNNMPLPSPRFAGDPGIRQAAALGVHPAGGPGPSENYNGQYAPIGPGMGGPGGAIGVAPVGFVPASYGRGPSYENAQMPGYAWPSYASYPNYAALSYPRQYSPTAWPYIGPFYPYPQVPLAWRKVSLEWDDGWWFLDFSAHNSSH